MDQVRRLSILTEEIKRFLFSENFPYFRADDDRWKNSVRHNLSMNPHFRKGTKSKSGSGHVWVLAGEGGPSQTPVSCHDLISPATSVYHYCY